MSTQLSPEMRAAARQAVRPVPPPSQAYPSSSSGTTPSWTSIVEAYHKEGNGDREMLLALLQAKAKEDERLAAMDLLRAEQMRAYAAHLAIHSPMFHYPPHPAAAAPQGSAKPMTIGPLSHHHKLAVTMPSPAPTASSSSSSSRRVSAASSSTHRSSRKSPPSPARSSTKSGDNRSRAPSLTNSVSSAGSSPASPAEGTLLLSLSAAAAAASLSSPKPDAREAQKVVLTAAQVYGKRRRSDDDDQDADTTAVLLDQPSPKRASPTLSTGARKTSPTLPGIASFDTFRDNGKSIAHILNADMRLNNSRLATSDVRSSSSSDEE